MIEFGFSWFLWLFSIWIPDLTHDILEKQIYFDDIEEPELFSA